MAKKYLVSINGDTAEIDEIGGYLVNIGHAHHKTHEGELFSVSDTGSSVDIVGPKYWRITTASTTLHTVFAVEASNATVVELFENPTISGAGTGLSVVNTNRVSEDAATLTAFYDTTTSGDGTLLASVRIGSNAGPYKVGSTRGEAEWIFKANEDYIIKCTVASDSTTVNFSALVYEV